MSDAPPVVPLSDAELVPMLLNEQMFVLTHMTKAASRQPEN